MFLKGNKAKQNKTLSPRLSLFWIFARVNCWQALFTVWKLIGIAPFMPKMFQGEEIWSKKLSNEQ